MRDALLRFIHQTFEISDFAARLIAEHFSAVRFSKGEYLLKEGAINNVYVFLESGYMRSFIFDHNNLEVTTGFFTPDQMVFDVASYFRRSPSKENIQALVDCMGWVGAYADFQQLFHSLPEFREFGRAILVKEFIALKVRNQEMIQLHAEQRYERLAAQHPQLLQQVALKHVASYLGITDSSLSRIRRERVNR